MQNFVFYWPNLPLFNNTLKKWEIPGLFHFFIFSNKRYNSNNKYVWKKVMSIQYTTPGFESTTFGHWVYSHNHKTRAHAHSASFLSALNTHPKAFAFKHTLDKQSELNVWNCSFYFCLIYIKSKKLPSRECSSKGTSKLILKRRKIFLQQTLFS